MVENNRKPIASLNMFPQFTTMNVIDGQAGVIIYSSLICHSVTIDNILNIIVLLILAGVTIATLTGDNGLLQKAQTASEKNTEATALEEIKVEVAGSYGLDGKIDKEQLNINLSRINGLTYNGNLIELTNPSNQIYNLPATVKLNGYSYTISENGSVNKVVDWIANSDGSFTNPETKTKINVGDIVHYETKLTANAVIGQKKEQLIWDLGEYSGNTNTSVNTDDSVVRDNLTWKVLDIKDGKIRLISTVPTSSKIRLYGADGYNNAAYLLDKACDTLYSIDGVGKAQNLKIEDIEKKLKIVDGKTARDNYTNTDVTPNLKYGDEKEYTSNLQYPNIYPSEVGCKAIATAENTGNTLGLSEQTSPVTGKSTATNRLKGKQTYWHKSMASTDFTDSKYYTLFINNGSNLETYWLSSRCFYCDSSVARFRVSFVYSGSVSACIMFYSGGNAYGDTCAFRPVVSLESNIQLSGDSTNGWTIQ